MPVDIKGKDYYTVADRIKMLNNDYGHSRYEVSTEIAHMTDKEVVIKATLTLIFPGKDPSTGNPLVHKTTFTGIAHEIRGAGFINETSHIENAETSAIGRCLAAAGYLGESGEYASANEVENAIHQRTVQNATKKAPRPLSKSDTELLEIVRSYKGHKSFSDEQNIWLDEFLNQTFNASHAKDIKDMHSKITGYIKDMSITTPKTKKKLKKETVNG